MRTLLSRYFLLLVGSIFTFASTACPSGKAAPTPTSMVEIPTTSFELGAGDPTCGPTSAPRVERCEVQSGADPDAWVEELSYLPRANASVDGFWIDEHEVTNEQYGYCVAMGACTAPQLTSLRVGDEASPYFDDPVYARHPVVYVTHTQAEAYCAFVDKRLPNEAEWELAARFDGQSNARIYPYGDAPLPSCDAGEVKSYIVHSGCVDRPPAVDYSEADRSQRGVRNMASNVSEWIADRWSATAYCENNLLYGAVCAAAKDGSSDGGINAPNCPCKADGAACAQSCDPSKLVLCKAGEYEFDRAGAKTATEHVVRGGSYKLDACFLRLFTRHSGAQANEATGFRCARTTPPPVDQRR